MAELVQISFFTEQGIGDCYDGLPVETVASLRQRAFRIKGIVHAAAVEVGKEFAEAKKEITPYKNGGFEQWVETETGITRAYAYQLINAYEKFGEVYNNYTLSNTAMLLLSSPSVSQEARNEAIQRAESGEKITVKIAKEIIEAKQAQERAEEEAQRAYEEAKKASQQLWQTQEVSRVRSEQLNAEIDRLKLEIELLKKPAVISPEAQTEIDKLTKQRDNLSQLVKDLSADLDTLREDKEVKRAQEVQDLRIRQNWRSTTDAFHKQVLKLLGQFPAPIDTQVFEAEDWERLSQVQELARRFQAECSNLHSRSTSFIVEAG